jgi:hypothetical protein
MLRGGLEIHDRAARTLPKLCFGAPMRTFRNRRAVIVVWTMVALTLVSGVPRIGCVCANGQHKLFCGKQFVKTCCQDGAAQNGNCPCCHGSELAGVTGHASCGGESSGGCTNHAQNSGDGKSISSRCCTRYMASPVVPTVEKNVPTPNALHDLALLDFVPNWTIAEVAAPARDTVRNPQLPIPDLVIAHQVFLI